MNEPEVIIPAVVLDQVVRQQEEIESQRQQVKVLENTIADYVPVAWHNEQIAKLKRSQGEPVARIVDTESALNVWWYTPPKELGIGTLLYTSAPTIPEGWQIVPIEPTPEMIRESIRAWYDCVGEPVNSVWIACYKAALDAAPKPEDVK